jgi:EmrB/QacA subfamily drug resistance transporter
MLAVIMLGSMMGTLDMSIANVALPTIAHVYHRSVDDAEWVILSFMLVTASTLVLCGRLGDMLGQKRIYIGGFAIFGASSLACAFAPSLEVLIGARAVQAIGAAMLLSSNQALIADTFPPVHRGRAIGLNGAAVAVGLSLGPLLGGAIVTYGDWRWIFLINVPISIVALAGAWLVLKPAHARRGGLDPAGALLSIAGLASFSLAFSRAHIWGWHSMQTIGLLLVAAAVITAFIFVERRVPAPTLDLSIFGIRAFAASIVAAFVYFIAFSGLTFIIPLSAQQALGDSAFMAGLLLMPVTAMNVVLAPIAGTISDRVPARYLSSAGALIVTIGSVLLARLPSAPSVPQLLGAILVTGAGTAIFTQPNNSAIMGAAPPNRRGIAAGTLATARTTGQLAGVAVASAVYFAQSAHEITHSFAAATDYFWLNALLMLGVTMISFWGRGSHVAARLPEQRDGTEIYDAENRRGDRESVR